MSSEAPLLPLVARLDPVGLPPSGAYVERTPAVAPRLARTLASHPRARVLVHGQSGVGKSAELQRLAAMLEAGFTVLCPPVEATLEPALVSWHDVFVLTAARALEGLDLTRRDVYARLDAAFTPPERPRLFDDPPPPPVPRSQARLSLVRPNVATLERGGAADAAPPLASERIRNNPRRARDIIAQSPGPLFELAVAALRLVEEQTGRPVVLVVDGLDRLPVEAVRRLFLEGRRHLQELPFRAVVTAPATLAFDPSYVDVADAFHHAERLRAMTASDGGPDRPRFEQLAAARGVDERSVTAEALAAAIALGGGLPRQFLQVLGMALVVTAEEGAARVGVRHVEVAARTLAERWHYQLGPSEVRALEKADAARMPEERARLLRLGALVEEERPGGGPRLVVNPLASLALAGR